MLCKSFGNYLRFRKVSDSVLSRSYDKMSRRNDRVTSQFMESLRFFFNSRSFHWKNQVRSWQIFTIMKIISLRSPGFNLLFTRSCHPLKFYFHQDRILDIFTTSHFAIFRLTIFPFSEDHKISSEKFIIQHRLFAVRDILELFLIPLTF